MTRAFRSTTSLLVALAAVAGLALGAGAPRAQAATLVSNTGQYHSGRIAVGDSNTGNLVASQRFSTGARRMVLTDVVIAIQEQTALSLTVTMTVGIYASLPSDLTASPLYALTSPSALTTGKNTFTAPESAQLEPNTDYYIVMRGASGWAGVSFTGRTVEDAGKESGWSIDNAVQTRRTDQQIWVTADASARVEVRGRLISSDAHLYSLRFDPRNHGITLRYSDRTSFDHQLYEETTSTTAVLRPRSPYARTTFIVDGAPLDGDVRRHGLTGLTVGTATTMKARVTAEDGVTTRDYTFRLAPHAKGPEPSEGAIHSANITVAEWANGMRGYYRFRKVYGRSSQNVFAFPGEAERTSRVGTLASVDNAGFGGFAANTIAVCFKRSMIVPTGRTLTQLRMRIDDTHDFRFRSATQFTANFEHCYKWPRAAGAFQWEFGNAVKMEFFVDDEPARGSGVVRNGAGRSPAHYGDTLSIGYGAISDPDGHSKAVAGDDGYAFQTQWVRVDGDAREDIAGATGSEYTVTAADRGKGIAARISFNDNRGNAETVGSSTMPVKLGTLDTSMPMLDNEIVLWSATLTPGATTGGELGCGTATTLCTATAALTANGFSYDGAAGTVNGLVQEKTGTRTGLVKLNIATAFGGNVEDLILTIGNQRLPLAQADYSTSDPTLYGWLDNDVDLASGAEVTVGLLRPSMKATLEKGLAIERGNGKLRYVFEIEMSHRRPLKVADLRKHVFDVTNGRIVRAKRLDKRRRTVNGRRAMYSNHWRLEVRPDEDTFLDGTDAADRIVRVAVAERTCAQRGALCVNGRWGMETPPAALEFGPPSVLGIKIGDATANEADGRILFPVTMGRASDWRVEIEYEFTSAGTATKGVDYIDPQTQTDGKNYMVIHPGGVSTTLAVDLIEDSIDDDGETIVVRITRARLFFPFTGNAAYYGRLKVADGIAVGTIENRGAMPAAWLARFGRTVASQAVDAIGSRMRGAKGTRIAVGGTEIGGTTPAGPGEAENPLTLAERFEAMDTDAARRTRSMSARDALLGSSFRLSAGGGNGAAAWTGWGRVATGGFEGDDDGARLDGTVTSAFLGADVGRDRWLAGVAVSIAKGDGDYSSIESGDGGSIESTLNAVYPYAKLGLTGKVDMWGLAGIGGGELTLNQTSGAEYKTDMAMRMGAMGLRGEVVSPAASGGLGVAVSSDAFWVRTESDAVTNADGTLQGAEGDASRLRLLVEVERGFVMGAGAIVPSAQIGLRRDGGDAETGAGVEVGGALRYESPGIVVEGAVRTLIAHERSEYEEWGASGAIRIRPGGSGRGLSLTIAPEWGTNESGVARLWGAEDARGFADADGFEPGVRIETEIGYGLSAPHIPGLLTPYTGLSMAVGGQRTWRLGTRWRVAPQTLLGFEATRAGGQDAPDAVRMRGSMRW